MIRPALILAVALSGCSTPQQPEGIESLVDTAEMAAYVTAKHILTLKPDYRSDFQSCADILGVLIDDWGNLSVPRPITIKQLQQALSWLPVARLESSGGVFLVREDDVLFNDKPIAKEMILPVASAIRAGLMRFLEIRQ